MRIFRLTLAVAIAGLLLLFYLGTASAQVLDDIIIKQQKDGASIHTKFSVPVRYLSHFPTRSGDTLIIELCVITLSRCSRDKINSRLSKRPRRARNFPLIDVRFEGNNPAGPRLVIRFRRTVKYVVRQGRDGRSIIVTLPNVTIPDGGISFDRPSSSGRYYGVLLLSSSTPISAARRRKISAPPGTAIYQTLVTEGNKKTYLLKLGFFNSNKAARRARRKLLSGFPQAKIVGISASQRNAVVKQVQAIRRRRKRNKGRKTATTKSPKIKTPSRIERGRYVVSLASMRRPFKKHKRLPASLDGYRIYSQKVLLRGKTWYRLRLGFFASRSEANAALRKVRKRYPGAWMSKTTLRERRASRNTALRMESGVLPVAASTRRIETRRPSVSAGSARVVPGAPVHRLMQQGRDAITRKRYRQAIRAFSEILRRPRGKHTQDAHELLALALERNRQGKLAIIEYRLYLKLYEKGEGPDRVRQRLAVLTLAGGRPMVLKAPKGNRGAGNFEVFGTWSQHFYSGNSKVDTKTKTGPVVVQQPTLSSKDQSLLISNLDFTAQYRTNKMSYRFIFSGENSFDDLDSTSESNVRSAYFEIKTRPNTFLAKIGRQSGSSGGVLGRFDGVKLSYKFLPKWRINLVGGSPDDEVATGSDRDFRGWSLDMGTFAGKWSGTFYQIRQEVDDITDREAIGAELRYFHKNTSIFSLLDYDTHFKEVNIFLVQANWKSKKGTYYNMLVDYRKNPLLQTTNALLGEPTTSIRELLLTNTEDQVKRLAQVRTSESRVLSFGALKQISKRMQWGWDGSVTNVSGLPDSQSQPPGVLLPASEGTGDIYTLSTKLISSNLIFKKDVGVLGASLTSGDAFDAASIFFTERARFHNSWLLDLSVKLYRQENANGTDLDRITPTVRLEYKKKNMAFEFEIGRERTVTTSSTQDEETNRDFYSIGYRIDF